MSYKVQVPSLVRNKPSFCEEFWARGSENSLGLFGEEFQRYLGLDASHCL